MNQPNWQDNLKIGIRGGSCGATNLVYDDHGNPVQPGDDPKARITQDGSARITQTAEHRSVN